METERYTAECPLSLAPAHLLHADKQLYSALWQTVGATAAVRSVWRGWSALTKGEASSWIVLIWCHVNILGLSSDARCWVWRIRPANSPKRRCWRHEKHKTVSHIAPQVQLYAHSINYSARPEASCPKPTMHASPNTCIRPVTAFVWAFYLWSHCKCKEKTNRDFHPVCRKFRSWIRRGFESHGLCSSLLSTFIVNA